MKRLKADIIILILILMAALAAFVAPRLLYQGSGGMVSVYQDGALWQQFPLSEEQTIPLTGPWGYNLLMISDGRARITDADCPDGLCVRQRGVSRNGESIICLPHKLVVEIEMVQPESGKETGLDAVTN